MAIYDVRNVISCRETQTLVRGVGWVPARPVHYHYESLRARLHAAWLVLIGRADALIWPGQ